MAVIVWLSPDELRLRDEQMNDPNRRRRQVWYERFKARHPERLREINRRAKQRWNNKQKSRSAAGVGMYANLEPEGE